MCNTKAQTPIVLFMYTGLSYTGKKEVRSYYGQVGKYLKVSKADFNSAPDPSYAWKTVANLDDPSPKVLVRSKRIVQDLDGWFSYFT